MRFKLGVLAGTAVGYWMATRSTEEKRRDVERLADRLRTDPLVGELRHSLGGAASRASHAASRRLSG